MNDDRPYEVRVTSGNDGPVSPEAGWAVRSILEILADDALPVVHVQLVDRPPPVAHAPLSWELLTELLCEV